MDQNKIEFVHDELMHWAEWIEKKLKEKFVTMKIGVTDELLKSLSFEVLESAGLNDGQYKLSFLEYGRFLDMGVGSLSKETISGNREAFKKASDTKIRRPKKWYGKTAYGGLNRLINSLVNGYQEEIVQTVKSQLA